MRAGVILSYNFVTQSEADTSMQFGWFGNSLRTGTVPYVSPDIRSGKVPVLVIAHLEKLPNL